MGLDDRVLDTGCLGLVNADSDGRFIDFVLVSCSPGDESLDVFRVLTSIINLLDCSLKGKICISKIHVDLLTFQIFSVGLLSLKKNL